MLCEGRQRLLMSLNSQKFRLATIALTGSLFLVFFLALWGSDLGDAAPEEEALEIISRADMEQLSNGMEEIQQQQQQQQAPPDGFGEDKARLSSVQNGLEQTSTRNASDVSSAKLSKKEKRDRREAGREAGLAGATRRVEKAGNKLVDPSTKAEARKRKKQKRQLGVGWVKAMFDRMDHDRDGIVTLSELSEFAEKWNLPTVYVQDFLRYADRSKNRTVTFQDFVTTIRAREMALNKACQPFENDEDMSVLQEVWVRGKWLIGLMVLQSLSGAILQHYETLIQDHVVVTFFLTMLVGAGGNAGNQSTIMVIEGMASGELDFSLSTFLKVLNQQLFVGILLAFMMMICGFLRVYVTNGRVNARSWAFSSTGFAACMAISVSLFTIVLTSVLVGCMLPFVMVATGVEAANAGPTIQVLMDILGVLVTCGTCKLVLEKFLIDPRASDKATHEAMSPGRSKQST